jgi:site-specific recombinase XerD
MYACGLRISEATCLQPWQIDKQQQTIRIIGKGNKERLIPVPPSILSILRQSWTTHRNPQWVFAECRVGDHIHLRTLRQAFHAACREAGISGFTPHHLRHSYATRQLERGVDTRVVQTLLGHARNRTTEIYTHLTEPKRQELLVVLETTMAGL